MDILTKIKQVNLNGCGGACYPTADKWQAVKSAFGVKKYVICNASEGEPGVFKDEYLLSEEPEKVIAGINEAIKFLTEPEVEVNGYIFINPEYAKEYGTNLKKIITKQKASIEIFIKPKDGGYICGEETTILNVIEGKKIEPRLKPPFPTTSGLFGCPTIINNVETFYHIAKLEDGDYKKTRFYTVSGECPNAGVYELSAGKTIGEVLIETNNIPSYKFIVQVGGGASGEVFNQNQLDRPVSGAMSITLYEASEWKAINLLRHWVGFFFTESCGQCTPCREGNYRLFEIINSKKPDWKTFFDILEDLSATSFCGLGLSVPIAIKSYLKNVLFDKDLKIKDADKLSISKYYK